MAFGTGRSSSFSGSSGGTGLFGGLNNSTATLGLFGNSGAKPTTGLFGNSSSNAGSDLFSSKRPTPLITTSGLFGASKAPDAPAAPGGLFGASKPAAPSGGLFGASNTTPAPSGGLFGASNSNSNTSAPSGGLFGGSNSSANTGLFGNTSSAAPAQQSGLFGSNTGNTSTSGGLFGNNNASTSSGLFGNSNTAGGGLFGNSSKPATSLFNNQPTTSGTSGLFGNNSNTSATNSNPYNYDQVFAGIQKDLSTMPLSITENVFGVGNKIQKESKTFSKRPSVSSTGSSLLNKLGKTFRIFRSSTSSSLTNYPGFSIIKGLFTQPSYVNTKNKQTYLPKVTNLGAKKFNKKSYRSTVNSNGASGDFKKLIIKTKPSRFHLINADKVLNSKKRRIITNFVSSNKILSNNLPTDDDSSDYDIDDDASKFPYKVNKADYPQSAPVAKDTSIEPVSNSDNDSDSAELYNGYWCSPPIRDLSKLSLEALANVENFIVGKVGAGQIAYSFPVDLSGIFITAEENDSSFAEELFDNIVKFQKKAVIVYGNPEKKQPIGFGLNVPATVTLIAPPAKNVTVEEHLKKIRNITGMEFITYDPITYQWVSKVKHFSVWGLIEDDEEESAPSKTTESTKKLLEMKKKQDEKEEEATLEYSKVYESDQIQQEIKRQKLSRVTSGLPGAWEFDSTILQTPLNTKKSLVEDEISRQISQYKAERAEEGIPDDVSEITIGSDDLDRVASTESLVFGIPDSTPIPEERRNFDYLKQIVSVLPRNVDMDELVNEKAYEPEVTNDAAFDTIQGKANLAVSDDWLVQLELASDLNSSLSPYVASLHPKTLNFEVVDELLFPNFAERASSNQASTPLKVSIGSGTIIEEDESESYEPYPENISKVIYTLLSKASIVQRNNQYPLVNSIADLTFSDFLINPNDSEEEKQYYALGSALFDKGDIFSHEEFKNVNQDDAQLVAYLTNGFKKQVFCNWLKNFNKATINELLQKTKSDILETVFLHICANDLKSAILSANNSNNSHLSVILTLLDSNDETVKAIAQSQLSYWSDTSSLGYIPKPVVKIYKILSGDFDDILSDLPWNIALSLQVFYGNGNTDLSEIVSKIPSTETDNQFIDLLKIYREYKASNSSEVLKLLKESSMGIKIKWLTFQVLLNQNLNDTESLNDTLVVDFGKYLENHHLWKEAIFVYSHNSNDTQAENFIRNAVISNINNLKNPQKNIDEEEYLVKVLKVPHSLIYESIAIQKHSSGEYWLECEALIHAKLWERAHGVIIDELGPTTVISNDEDSQKHLLDLISKFPHLGLIIPTWRQGAGAYASYLKLASEFDKGEEIAIHELDQLLTNIALLKVNTSFKSGVAMKIMSKRLGDISITYKESIGDIKDKVFALKLGENEKEYFSVRLQ